MNVLQGVDRYRVMDPLFESVRVVLSYRGEDYTPATIQGLSGAAFRVAGICPCAPTCSSAMEPVELIALLGYEHEHLPLWEEGLDLEREGRRVVERVKDEIRAGRPAMVWHAFTTAEWDVVCGFDEESDEFLGRGSYAGWEAYARADQMRTIRCLDICPAIGAILIGDKMGELDIQQAEVAALQEAVRHGRSRQNEEKVRGGEWAMLDGLLAYERWIDGYHTDPPKTPNMGDRYCMGVYRSTHRAGAGFLREIAPRYPDAAALFKDAAQYMTREADALNACAELLFPGWKLPAEGDGEQNQRAADLLSEARDAYAGALDAIEEALIPMTTAPD